MDLIEAYDDLAALVPGSAESAPNVREIEEEQRQLRFGPVTAEVAADLLLDNRRQQLLTRYARKDRLPRRGAASQPASTG